MSDDSQRRALFFIRSCITREWFDARTGQWWAHFGECEVYSWQGAALARALEFDLEASEIVCLLEIRGADTMIEDGDDPNAGEEWKRG